MSGWSAVHAGNPQDQQDRDLRRNMKYERDTAIAEMVLGDNLWQPMLACLCADHAHMLVYGHTSALGSCLRAGQ